MRTSSSLVHPLKVSLLIFVNCGFSGKTKLSSCIQSVSYTHLLGWNSMRRRGLLPLDKLWFCMMEMSLLAAARSARRRQRNADSQNTGSGLDSHMLNGGHDHCGACCCGSCGALKLTQTEVDLRRLSAQIPSGSMVLTTKGQAVIE